MPELLLQLQENAGPWLEHKEDHRKSGHESGWWGLQRWEDRPRVGRLLERAPLGDDPAMAAKERVLKVQEPRNDGHEKEVGRRKKSALVKEALLLVTEVLLMLLLLWPLLVKVKPDWAREGEEGGVEEGGAKRLQKGWKGDGGAWRAAREDG